MHSKRALSRVTLCKFMLVLVLLAGTAWAAPLEITLQDAVLSVPLPEKRIDAYARKNNGSLSWQAWGYTDRQGKLVLELKEFEPGQAFVLRARNPFGTGDVYSKDIHELGAFVFAVGNLKLKFVSGIDGKQPLAAKRVYLRQKQSDGSLKWYRSGTTSAAGEVRFHAEGLDQGIICVPKAPSPVDGRWKYGAAITTAGTHTITVGEVLAVKLRDALDENAGLAGKQVIAYQVQPDGKLRGRKRGYTDGQGNLLLDLDGLSQKEGIYRLRVRNPFGTGDIYSKDIHELGAFVFAVGNLKLKFVSGIDGKQPLAAKRVYLRQKPKDEALKWYRYGTTSAAGEVRFHAEGLDQGITYVPKAPSPVDGRWKYGAAITTAGTHTITVGEVLAVKLRDALDENAGLAGKQVIAYQVQPDGKLRRRKHSYTDGQGNLLLDLDGLSQKEGIYRLRVRNPFGTGDIYSKDIQELGAFVFAVGNLKLKFVSGIDGKQPLAAKRVYLRQKPKEGALKWYRYGTTSAAGEVRFHAEWLDQGITYVPQAPSPVDGRWKYGAAITTAGTHTITVGEVLAVKLRDALDENAGLDGKQVIAYQVQPDGKLRWRKRGYTDGQGNLLLDLDGLSQKEGIYRLRVHNPFGTGDVYSKDIHELGAFVFAVGNLKLKFVSGIDGKQPLAAKRVYLRQKPKDEALKWYRYGTTSAAGEVRFHAEGLDQGITYVPKAPSPVDGHWKYGAAITQAGVHTISVGEVLAVKLRDALDENAGLAGKQVTAYQVQPDGKLRRRKHSYTDGQGNLLLDLDGLSQKEGIYRLRVNNPFGTGDAYSTDIKDIGQFVFKVGNLQITLINAVNNQPLSENRIYLKHKLDDGRLKCYRYGYTDPSGAVRFHVPDFDQGRDSGVYVAKARA